MMNSRHRITTATRRGPTLRSVALVVLGAVLVLGGWVAPTSETAVAATATPGATAAPVKISGEYFENGGPAAVPLTSYVAVDGTTYTADPYWLDGSQCNGIVMSFNSGTTPGCPSDSDGGAGARQNLQRLADILGQHRLGVDGSSNQSIPSNGSTAGTSPATASQANRVVGETTGYAAPPANSVEFRTADNTSSLPNRFLALAVDVADVSCERPGESGSELGFSFIDAAGNELSTGGEPYAVCTDPAARYYASPFPPGVTGWVYGGGYGAVSTMKPTNAVLVPGNSFGYLVKNHAPAGAANDHALDNFSVYDVTPQLHQEFPARSIPAGTTAELRITVTNTSELGSKHGWSFTNTLPEGLTVTSDDSISNTCANGAGSSTVGGESYTVSGDLLAGQVACTVTVKVTSSGPRGGGSPPRTYRNCAADFTSLLGLNAPPCAAVHFHSKPGLSVAKTSDARPDAVAGDVIHYTLTATNTGTADYTAAHPASVTDDLGQIPGGADYNHDARSSLGQPPKLAGNSLLWSGALVAGQSVTITYSVTLSLDGDRVVTNTACVPVSEAESGTANCAQVSWPMAHIVVTKSVDPSSGSPVTVNQNLTYTLSFRNTGTGAEQIDRIDDLSGILDDASIRAAPVASDPAWIVDAPQDGKIRIQGSLEPGQSASVHYLVNVNADGKRADNVLISRLLPEGTNPRTNLPGGCQTQAEICTTNPVSSFSVAVTTDKAVARPGDAVTYTATVVNTGAVDIAAPEPARATGDLTGVLDDARYNGNAPETVQYDNPQLTWSTELAAGEQRATTYSVTVRSSVGGDRKLRNIIIGGSNCPQGSTAQACAAETDVSATVLPRSEVQPRSDAGPGTEQGPGDSGAIAAAAGGTPNWAMITGGLGALMAGLLGNLSRFPRHRRPHARMQGHTLGWSPATRHGSDR